MEYNNDLIQINKVRQSNDLVESPYAQDFTSHEIKLFEIAAAGVQASDIENANKRINKRYKLTSREIAKLLNTSVSTISHEIEKTTTRIMKKAIHLRKILNSGEVEFELINIIPYAKYSNGILEYDLNYAIMPYIVEINKNFTEFQLKYLLSLKSTYAIKLYKLLYQYKTIKSRTFSITELKGQFGIVDKYPMYKNFKQKILIPSVQQINKLTDLDIIFNELKQGRNITKILFNFQVKQNFKIVNKSQECINKVNTPINNSFGQIEDLEKQFSKNTFALIKRFFIEKGKDYIESCIHYAKKNARSNLDKYLADTLSNDWAAVEIEKLEIKKNKQLNEIKNTEIKDNKILQEKQREHFLKSEIEHQWNKLTDKEKQKFMDYSEFINKKYKLELSSFADCEEKLPISIFAVSNNRFYNHNLESYIKNMIKISLNVNNLLKIS